MGLGKATGIGKTQLTCAVTRGVELNRNVMRGSAAFGRGRLMGGLQEVLPHPASGTRSVAARTLLRKEVCHRILPGRKRRGTTDVGEKENGLPNYRTARNKPEPRKKSNANLDKYQTGAIFLCRKVRPCEYASGRVAEL